MGLLGKFLSLPIRIANAPIRAAETILGSGSAPSEDQRIISKPLDALATELEKVDGDG